MVESNIRRKLCEEKKNNLTGADSYLYLIQKRLDQKYTLEDELYQGSALGKIFGIIGWKWKNTDSPS